MTGEDYYLQVAKNFWDIVINNHTYITGGNSEWEHFGEPKILDGERTNCNCETCNTYNMLKLTRELFKITGNRKYADYYENAFINEFYNKELKLFCDRKHSSHTALHSNALPLLFKIAFLIFSIFCLSFIFCFSIINE